MKMILSILSLLALSISMALANEEEAAAKTPELPDQITSHPEWTEWETALGDFRAKVQFVSGATVFLFDGGRITLPAEEDREPVLLLREAEQESLERALSQRERWERTVNKLEEERAQRLARGYTGPRPVSTEGLLEDVRNQDRRISFGDIRLSRDWDGSFRLGTVRDNIMIPVSPMSGGPNQPWYWQQDTRPIIVFND